MAKKNPRNRKKPDIGIEELLANPNYGMGNEMPPERDDRYMEEPVEEPMEEEEMPKQKPVVKKSNKKKGR